MNLNINLDGVEDAVIRASRYNIKVENEVKEAIKQSANSIKNKARANVRTKTKRLKRSITVKDTSRRAKVPTGFAKTVHARNAKGGHHGHLVEDGSGQRSGPVSRFGKNRGKMPASPYIRPAAQQEEGKFSGKLRRIAERNEII